MRNLEAASQEVPAELMELAMKSSWFKNSRFESQHECKECKLLTRFGFFWTDSSEAKEVEEATGKKIESHLRRLRSFEKYFFSVSFRDRAGLGMKSGGSGGGGDSSSSKPPPTGGLGGGGRLTTMKQAFK